MTDQKQWFMSKTVWGVLLMLGSSSALTYNSVVGTLLTVTGNTTLTFN